MSSGGGTQTVTEKRAPWEASQPYLKDIMGQARGTFNSGAGNEYFPFSTTVPFSNQTEGALDQIEGLAGQTPDFMNSANSELNKTISGDYLNPGSNPYLDGAFNRGADQITDRVNSAAGLRGRVGSGAHQELLTKNLGELSNSLYGGNYQQERGRQQQGMFMAPTFDDARFSNAQRLGSVGASREAQAGNQLQDAMDRFQFGQNAPWDQLNNYNSIIQGFGNLGSTGTSTQPSAKSGGFGGAASGALAGSGGGAPGMIGGAILGGLFG